MTSTMAIETPNDSNYYIITKVIVTKVIVNKESCIDSAELCKTDTNIKKIKFNSDITIYEYKYKKNTILKKISFLLKKKYFGVTNGCTTGNNTECVKNSIEK